MSKSNQQSKASAPPPSGDAAKNAQADAQATKEALAALAADGKAAMVAPSGSTGCSFGGESYDADEDGFVVVPVEAVATLMDHGFTLPVAGAV